MATAPAALVNGKAGRDVLPAVEALIPALQRLDALLLEAVAIAAELYGPPGGDPFRGLYVDRDEVEWALHVTPGEPLLYTGRASESRPDDPDRLGWLRRAYGLSPFDLDVLILALAPELDRRYERVYAYLQNHVSLRRPTVDLALHLFCSDALERLVRRNHFDPEAPLIRHGLLALAGPSHDDEPALLSHQLVPGEQVVRFLLYQDSPGATLAAHVRSDGAYRGGALLPEGLEQYVERVLTEGKGVGLYFRGPAGSGRRCAAQTLADRLDRPLLHVDHEIGTADRRVRHALLHFVRMVDVVLYVHETPTLLQTSGSCRLLRSLLSVDGTVVTLAGETPWPSTAEAPTGTLTVPFALPDVAERKVHWHGAALARDLALNAENVAAVSHRFRLGPEQIAAAATEAELRARWRGDGHAPTRDDLFRAARAQSGHELAGLAQKIDPHYQWEDIVLPEDTLAQLHEISDRVEHREQVLHEWGFAGKLSHGLGVNALFAGPSGTGKTMAAEIIANELGLDLYCIDLSGVVSKYIGETEKNLARVFRAAENANAILLFDEADALFGKRSEVRDSHDRYANIEISYLLQKMEAYEGLAILATNLHQNLDEAFTRRMAFTVHFSMPNEERRREIWRRIWPAETPRAADADLDLLAREFKLSGGNIKNIALAAAYGAAADGRVVTMEHLLHGVRREYQKMGRALSTDGLPPSRMPG